MEKTIKIGKQDVRLTNNVSWAIIYRDQFGHDIIPTLVPMIAAATDIVSGLVSEANVGKGEVGVTDILRVLDGDTLLDAVIHLSGLEFVEFINITWAMAKACDDDIPEPRVWVRSFEDFPLDKVVPEVVSLAIKGLVSSKNLKRLRDLTKTIKVAQPQLKSTPLSSPDSNED